MATRTRKSPQPTAKISPPARKKRSARPAVPAAGATMDQLLSQIIEQAVELLEAEPGGGSICLVNPATGILEVAYGIGSSAHAIGRVMKPGEGLVGRVFATGKAMAVEDYTRWEGHIPEFATGPGESVMVVPLVWQGQRIGTLGIESINQDRVFGPKDIRIAELFAAQAALSIGSARLLDTERKAHERMQAILMATRALSSSLSLNEVLTQVLECCKMVLPFASASIMTIEGGVPVLAALLGYEGMEEVVIERTKSDLKPSQIIKRMMSDHLPVIIPDVRENPDWINLPGGEHIRGWLGLPLIARGDLIGMLMLNSDQVGAYTQEHVEVGQIIATQATIALENAQLFSAMEHALTQIEAYFKASEEIVAATDAESLLRIVARPALQDGPCQVYLIYLDGPEDGPPEWSEILACIEQPPSGRDLIGHRSPIQEFATARLLASRPHGVLIIDRDHPASILHDSYLEKYLADRQILSMVTVPLTLSERLIGAVVITWNEFRTVSSTEELFYSVVAPQLAAIIQNQRLLHNARQAEERFRDMALSSSDWVWEADSLGRITYCSERVKELAGYEVSDILGKTPFDFMSHSSTRRFRAQMGRLAKHGGKADGLELWFYHKDGRLLCHLVSAIPIFAESDKLIGYRGVSKDITEQKRAEQREKLAYDLGQTLTAALKVDEIDRMIVRQLRRTFGYYDVALWHLDPETNILSTRSADYNTEYAEYGEERPHLEIPLDAQPSIVAQTARTQQMIVSNDVRSDPNFLSNPVLPDSRSEAALPLVHGGKLLGVLNVESTEVGRFDEAELRMLQNLTAQTTIALANSRLYRQLEEQTVDLEELVRERTGEVLRERERLQSIVENAGEGIIFTRADGIIEYVNPSWEKITGTPSADVIGRRLSDIVGDEITQRLNHMLGSYHPGDSWEGEMTASRSDGSKYDALLRVAPVPDVKGRIGNLVGVMHDITARKQVDRMRSKFVANVSHELRTPITNLKLYHTLIAGASGDKLAEYVTTMGDQVGRLEKLVEDLLDVSRLDRGTMEIQPELTDLNQQIRDVLVAQELRAERRGLTISSVLLPDLPPTYVDQKRMSQVITNLLTNAINYTPEGQQIGVRSWREFDDSTEWVAFSVWDNGMGIAPQDLPFIFEPFFRAETTKDSGSPGTGLGLSIVREIVELHRGLIKVESQLGRGTTFTVRLPAYAAPGK